MTDPQASLPLIRRRALVAPPPPLVHARAPTVDDVSPIVNVDRLKPGPFRVRVRVQARVGRASMRVCFCSTMAAGASGASRADSDEPELMHRDCLENLKLAGSE
jgi:hypothetical protein